MFRSKVTVITSKFSAFSLADCRFFACGDAAKMAHPALNSAVLAEQTGASAVSRRGGRTRATQTQLLVMPGMMFAVFVSADYLARLIFGVFTRILIVRPVCIFGYTTRVRV